MYYKRPNDGLNAVQRYQAKCDSITIRPLKADGEKIRVESTADPTLYYDMDFLDIAVVPAYFGKYRIRNLGVGTVVVHKTLLKN